MDNENQNAITTWLVGNLLHHYSGQGLDIDALEITDGIAHLYLPDGYEHALARDLADSLLDVAGIKSVELHLDQHPSDDFASATVH